MTTGLPSPCQAVLSVKIPFKWHRLTSLSWVSWPAPGVHCPLPICGRWRRSAQTLSVRPASSGYLSSEIIQELFCCGILTGYSQSFYLSPSMNSQTFTVLDFFMKEIFKKKLKSHAVFCYLQNSEFQLISQNSLWHLIFFLVPQWKIPL